jgi:hypothetical protein
MAADATYAKLKGLLGRQVRAKRAGWDDPPGGLLHSGDLTEPLE